VRRALAASNCASVAARAHSIVTIRSFNIAVSRFCSKIRVRGIGNAMRKSLDTRCWPRLRCGILCVP
jgi:hypothetical protein